MGVRLVIADNKKKVYHTLSEEITTIGRGSGCTIELTDRNLSRTHCQIERVEGGWQIRDLDSQNGTRVNNQPVKKALLQPGDEITIGQSASLRFEDTDFAPGGELARDRIVWERDNLLGLLDITREMTSELRLQTLLEKIMDRSIDTTGAERGFLILLERGEMNFAVARNIERHQIDQQEFRVSRSLIKNVAATGKPEILDSALDDTRYGQEQSIVEQELVSVICVPLLYKENITGLIYLANDLTRDAFTASHLNLLEAFAAQAAIAIENARLYESVLAHQAELETAKATVDRLNEQLQEKIEDQSREIVQLEKTHPAVALKYDYSQIIGRSAKLQAVFKLLDRVTETRVPVLIQGESGTGKELVAKAIHFNGELKGKRFVSINCGALTETLLESELFGHVRGAFTGAVRDRKGLFEIADGGTIFLDEVGEMSPGMQKKLLRILQEGEFTPVGGMRVRKVRVRTLSASNKDLPQLVHAKQFREDLYYRLNVITVQLPPLRERSGDVPLLVEHFLTALAKGTDRPARKVDSKSMALLVAYDWPGNVRELENEITRAVALCKGVITSGHLSEHVQVGGAGLMRRSELEGKSLKQIVSAATWSIEKQAIETALKFCDYKKVKAARLLDISRPTLDAKINAFDINAKPDGHRR